ncbi:MAG: GNAT family N-acetyltransferase, partial [Acidimicrobiia bacterium]
PMGAPGGWNPERISWLKDFHRHRRDGLSETCGEATWAVRSDGRVVGSVRLRRTSTAGVLETGIWLTRTERNRGMGRRAVSSVLEHAAAAGAHSVRADTTIGNQAALAILHRLGFEVAAPEGTGRIEARLPLRPPRQSHEVFTCRIATRSDLPLLHPVMTASIDELQRAFLRPEQVAASHAIMGVDTQLIDDGTYFVVESGPTIAGCGGWSRRATLYGGDHTAGRDGRLLDPAVDAARVRAMYTDPRFARRGVGRLVLEHCQAAAAAEGFRRLELVATVAGLALYRGFGFATVETFTDTTTGTAIPLTKMAKAIDADPGLPHPPSAAA